MLPKSRIDKLKGLKTYDINSIGTSKKLNPTPIPLGKNSPNIFFSVYVY